MRYCFILFCVPRLFPLFRPKTGVIRCLGQPAYVSYKVIIAESEAIFKEKNLVKDFAFFS